MEKEKSKYDRQIRWKAANRKQFKVDLDFETFEQFELACKTLGVTRSAVVKEAIEKVIEKSAQCKESEK